jgi:hypothetical protein
MVTLHFSKELVRRSQLAFWLRFLGWRFAVTFIVAFACLGCLLILNDRSWIVGAMGAGIGFSVLMLLAVIFHHYRFAMSRLHLMRRPEASFEAGENNFRISSDLGTADFPWNAIIEIWRFPDFWLLFFTRGQFITLPVADLDSDAQKVILTRLKAHGTKLS